MNEKTGGRDDLSPDEIIKRLAKSGREKDEPVLTLSAALVVAETERDKWLTALRRIAHGEFGHAAAFFARDVLGNRLTEARRRGEP